MLLATAEGVIKGAEVALGSSAGFRGLAGLPDGDWLAASTEQGHIQLFRLNGTRLMRAAKITITPKGQIGQPCAGWNGDQPRRVAALRGSRQSQCRRRGRCRPSKEAVKEYPVQNLPFEPRLSEDESTLIVSNWGGRSVPTRRTNRQEPEPRHPGR